jgi:hypothetical protein
VLFCLRASKNGRTTTQAANLIGSAVAILFSAPVIRRVSGRAKSQSESVAASLQ